MANGFLEDINPKSKLEKQEKANEIKEGYSGQKD